MKHHFVDLLDRSGDYWTTIPNIERYAYNAETNIVDKENVKILTINKKQHNWHQVFDCKNLEELTLHDPSKEQVQAIAKLNQLKRLRITFFRTADINFIGELENLEELILEYVSGFTDLSPLSSLSKLKSVHFENLRRVSNFDGLRGLKTLRYLHIDGTVDWNQPIEDFEFLGGLPNLEVLSLGFITIKKKFPAFLPILNLKKLKKIKIGRATLSTNEYAFLQVALPNVQGCSWALYWDYQDKYDFLGKRAEFIKKRNPGAKERCDEFKMKFEEMKKEAVNIIKSYSG